MFPQLKAYEALGVGLLFVVKTWHSESLRSRLTEFPRHWTKPEIVCRLKFDYS